MCDLGKTPKMWEGRTPSRMAGSVAYSFSPAPQYQISFTSDSPHLHLYISETIVAQNNTYPYDLDAL